MIKENKKNKIITFLCACLIVCASALGLVSAVGTTLASSPTQPTITADYFNYKDSNFLNLFDGYITKFRTGTSGSQLNYTITHVTDLPSSTTASGFTIDKFYYLSGSSVSGGNTFVQGVYTTDGMFGGLPTITFTFSNATNFISGMNEIYSKVLVFSYNGTYYTICPLELYSKHIAYMEGLADADTTSAYNNGVVDGQNNVINNPNNFDLYTQAQYQQNYVNGQNSVINNPSAFGLYTQAQYEQNYTDGYNAGIIQGQNNVVNNPNNFGLNTNQQLQDSYNQGFADGEQSSDAYQNGYDIGYTDGSNEVLNNPNNYNLYTQAQYEQNYTDGYNKGLTYARYGIYADITAVVKYGNLSANNVINEPFAYYLNGLIFSENVISMFPPDNYQSGIMTVEINFNNDFVYTNDDFLKFFLPQTRVANVEYNLIDINNNVYTYVSSVETTGSTSEDRETIFSNGPKVVDGSYVTGPVPSGSIIKSIEFTLINPNYYILTQFYFHQIDNGYDLGYTTGFDQGFKNGVVVGGNESYQTGYNNGSVDGFNSGYAQGLANQDNATFASMISAVIDVPINAMRNLFNFELLGINLFGFFTALFTLLIVITIIRLILGGK